MLQDHNYVALHTHIHKDKLLNDNVIEKYGSFGLYQIKNTLKE